MLYKNAVANSSNSVNLATYLLIPITYFNKKENNLTEENYT